MVTIINHNYLYAYQQPISQAIIKKYPGDFLVNENLPFTPDGQGSHVFLSIEKNSLNTLDVVQQLAKFSGLEARHIGYAGLKDKHAITTQWFSINLEGLKPIDWDKFSHQNINIKSLSLHKKKLKTGTVLSNDFTLILRDVDACNKNEIESKIEKIRQYGVPNYFGPQRFGINNQNLNKAQAWFSGKLKIKQRSQKSIILSAARSFLFNHLLSQRIESYGWNKLISGEVMILDGTQSLFTIPGSSFEDSDIISRFNQADIHPSLSLWGKGDVLSHGNLAQLENSLVKQFPQWCQALENKGLKQQRRSIRVLPQQLQYNWLNNNQLQLQFSLVKGSYATSVLRELFSLTNGSDRTLY